MFDEEFGPEPYENDLEDFGNREAWEDAQAERDEPDEPDEPDFDDEPYEYNEEP